MECPSCHFQNAPAVVYCGKCAKRLEVEAQTLTGPVLLAGRYELVKPLGVGGMGAVYKAKDHELNRIVALKLIRPELAKDEEMLQRFKQELILARKITHKNVVRIYDLGEDAGFKFITMDYIEGQDLRALLRERGKLSSEGAVPIIQQVCRALHAAHSEGVVHRDLKPHNIMVDPGGNVFVMDFGIARSMEQSGMTRTGALMGTPEYMSPEQARGLKTDARSDLFSLGVIFYELLIGKSPYESDTPIGTMLKRLQEPAVPPIQVDATIPQPLNDLVLKCLEIDPQRRYQHAREILQDLEARQGTRTGSAVAPALPSIPPTSTKLWQAWLPRLRSWRWITAGVALVLLVLAAVLFWSKAPSQAPAQQKPLTVLVADFNNATGEPIFDGTLEPTLITALEGASFINAYDRGAARKIAAQVQPGATKLDEPVAKLIARREGINYIVAGSIAREGGAYRLSLRALDAFTGRTITSQQIAGTNKQGVLGATAKLAARIRTALGDDTPEDLQVAAAETFTAASIEAAHNYAVAQDLQLKGKHEDSIRYYLQAVELDPNLGRAYSGLATAHVIIKKHTEAGEYYKKALALLGNMSVREKHRTLGAYYGGYVRNYRQAVDTYRKLLELFPADSAAYNNLGVVYVYTRNFPEAVAAARRAMELVPASTKYRYNFSLYSMYASDFETAITETQRVLKDNPSYDLAYLPLALSTLARGDVPAAREIYSRLAKVSPQGSSLSKMGEADLEMYLGRYKEGIEILKAGIAADEREKNLGEMAHKDVAMAEAHLALGQRPQAASAASKAAELSPTEFVLFPAARILLQAGEEAKARRIAESLDSMLQIQTKSFARLIVGEIALQRNRLPEAVEAFREGQKLLDSWIAHLLLGKAYVQAGHFAEALAELEICRKRRGEAADFLFADSTTLRYLPPLYYWLARAQQGVGMADAARQSYQEFLKLRAEANPGDPLVADAKRRSGS